MAPLPVVVDSDTGIDDALALLYLARRPEIDVVAVGCVHGNAPVGQVARNTLQVLRLAGLDHVPVAVGARRPLASALPTRRRPRRPGHAEHVHGDDGLGGLARATPGAAPVAGSAAEHLVRLARERPGQLAVLATGPLTNLGLALLLEPELPHLVERVVVMGGAFAAPGGAIPPAETNILGDPEAADLVLDAGWPLTIVGLDVTMRTILEEDHLRRLAGATSPAGTFAWEALQCYLDAYEPRLGRRGCPVHDALAAAILVDPTLATCREMAVRVELDLPRGATLARPAHGDRSAVRVVGDVDADTALGHLLDALNG